MWSSTKNLVGVDSGNFRSIVGYAGESLAIGRALVCGYSLFFKAWRDAKYDAVLDYHGVLYRVEIKQTTVDQISTSSGGRSGQQISREAASREQVLSTSDCDFVVGIHSLNGECWLLPIELVEILQIKQFKISNITEFYEKWGIFKYQDTEIDPNRIRRGFRELQDDEIERIASNYSIPIPDIESLTFKLTPRSHAKLLSKKDYLILKIWYEIFKRV